jgi:hypothetical protein
VFPEKVQYSLAILVKFSVGYRPRPTNPPYVIDAFSFRPLVSLGKDGPRHG